MGYKRASEAMLIQDQTDRDDKSYHVEVQLRLPLIKVELYVERKIQYNTI